MAPSATFTNFAILISFHLLTIFTKSYLNSNTLTYTIQTISQAFHYLQCVLVMTTEDIFLRGCPSVSGHGESTRRTSPTMRLVLCVQALLLPCVNLLRYSALSPARPALGANDKR